MNWKLFGAEPNLYLISQKLDFLKCIILMNIIIMLLSPAITFIFTNSEYVLLAII